MTINDNIKRYRIDKQLSQEKLGELLGVSGQAYAITGQNDKAIEQYEEILEWLEEHGYNMDIEGEYPRKRIEELKKR